MQQLPDPRVTKHDGNLKELDFHFDSALIQIMDHIEITAHWFSKQCSQSSCRSSQSNT